MEGAIFDVDGTLLDSMRVWSDVTERFFKERGIYISEKQAASYKELTLEESLPMISEQCGLGMSFEEISGEFRRMVEDEYRLHIPLKPCAARYVERLHREGVKIAVATSGYEGLCEEAFKRTGIYDYIDAYAFSSEVGCNKSRPDVYLLAARRIGVAPEKCTVFEDIVPGIGSAVRAGFMTCAVYDDTNSEDTNVLKQLSDRYITGWDELLRAI